MASKCPKCHAVLDDDVICCADAKYTWKCASCGKLSTGFVVPYGRCFLCGGKTAVVEDYKADNPAKVAVVQEAMQYELDMYHFYRLAMQQTRNEELRGVLEEFYRKEEDHLEELEQKYHVHLDPELRMPAGEADGVMSQWIFQGIDLGDAGEHVLQVYDKAIEMERRTRDHFKARADALPAGPDKEIYRELAAEEEDHVAILETEREQFGGSR